MNRKAFTLVELILVITIIGIISAITIPNIMESLNESKKEGGKAVEDLLIENLKLYNIDYEEDLWCLENSTGSDCKGSGKIFISFDKLLELNPDIDLGQCLLKDDEALSIKSDGNRNYTYTAKIICSKDFENSEETRPDSNIASTANLNNKNIYYDSEKN